MNQLLTLSRWIDRINSAIGWLAGWLVLVMIGVGCWNVIGRYVGQAVGQNLSSNALIETQWYLFSVVFLMGAAYTLRRNDHVRVDIFQSGWSGRRRALADLVGTLLFLLPFCALVLVFSWKWVLASWRISELSPDPGGLPRYPIKSLILISFIALIGQGISEAIKNLAILTGHRPAHPPASPPASLPETGPETGPETRTDREPPGGRP
ncbi:TRAP transporter small permease subunit [Romeria aff. gracilis LEGE 07310]|uniref:TRAP transporter small permease subunit n=1 Tax=Vasconcelosia minhoensis LEGE 07310 TaxID=915328 RepID=A0A8J7A880_9CYAN|nr:TRAP transporter small permease subunit [Romeria gracilis]MBE9075701.1 TRAP transporter small permease subunit [Romeria aff. gracilis LEGE 07310]